MVFATTASTGPEKRLEFEELVVPSQDESLPFIMLTGALLTVVEEDHQSTSPADAWLQKCQACQTFEQVLPLVREYERMAIDWDEVAGAFREEWQAKKNKKKTKKQKGLTPAEEAALAATTQVCRTLRRCDTLSINHTRKIQREFLTKLMQRLRKLALLYK